MIVTTTTVAPLYLAKVKALLTLFTVAEVILPDGEQYKTLDTVNEIFTELLTARFDRSKSTLPSKPYLITSAIPAEYCLSSSVSSVSTSINTHFG
jgi:hypothetical protein